MAFPSNIPTSFVPNSTASQRRYHLNLADAFNFIAYAVFGVIVILTIGVFFYDRILASEQAAKDAQIAKAEAAVDITTIEGFVRLSNRLTFGETLLSNHVAFSQFFALIESIIPTTVRFSSMHLSVDPAGAVKLESSGTARNFNALAAVSTVLAKDGRIKDAIFSNISVNAKSGAVSFVLSAMLDPGLVAFSAPAAGSGTQEVSTTP